MHMTKPTDRQIEAVEDVLRGLVIITGDSTWDMNYVARRVLTVAAEVGPQCGNDKSSHKMDCTWPTVYDTAAAEMELVQRLDEHQDYVDNEKLRMDIAAAAFAIRSKAQQGNKP